MKQEEMKNCPVNSFNEWDPLEEVIVGRLDHATIPPNHVSVTATVPHDLALILQDLGSKPYPPELVQVAQSELNEFIHILESEGIKIRRPEVMHFEREYGSSNWRSKGSVAACPRDGLLVLGNTIIETPMAWRSRYFEVHAYYKLLLEYFKQGANWISAPKPQLLDELYDEKYEIPKKDEPVRYVIRENEIVFDAADFVRCGKDLFVTQSNVTNRLAIDWLERVIGDQYNIHVIESRCRQPMHIDSTFMPLAPGKVLVNPEYVDVDKLPSVLKSWDILVAPQPDIVHGDALFDKASMSSMWISLNVLMLDEKRIVVEKSQVSMIKALKSWGFEPIPCAFMNYAPFGGSFHCCTLDIRRRGTLQSYF